ncbi:MAG: hypothetical protein CM1200mP2_15610 [Planctomycetaceae bacterium]|nr:MAG: hypothetical protein CM1200mP2_15610 [Planctomycetaceae bacterium]
MPLTVWILTMRRSRIIVLLVALGLIAMAVPVAIRINEILRFSQSVTHVADTIRSFESRRPRMFRRPNGKRLSSGRPT